VTTPENPARWAPDPLGRHQYRYWDGAQWTEHVSDDGTVSVDAPTVTPPPTSTTPGAPSPPMPGTGASSWTRAAPTTPYAYGYDPTAVLGRRYGAFFIDAAICLVAFALFFFPFATERTRAETLRIPGCHLSSTNSKMVECDNRFVITVNDKVYEPDMALFIGLSVLFTFLYFGIAEGVFGGSLGKHLTGIRVVTAQGHPIGIGQSLGRWAVFAVDGPLTLFLCGIIMSAVRTGHQRLGDRAAGSYVIGRADVGRPIPQA
jgi:uncharacterized RDD family membrane protein YckC